MSIPLVYTSTRVVYILKMLRINSVANMATIAVGMRSSSTGTVAHRLRRPSFGSMYQSTTPEATIKTGPRIGIIAGFPLLVYLSSEHKVST